MSLSSPPEDPPPQNPHENAPKAFSEAPAEAPAEAPFEVPSEELSEENAPESIEENAPESIEENSQKNLEENFEEKEKFNTPLTPVDHIPVCVEFRVGEAVFAVDELRNLCPGVTLTDVPGLLFPRVQAVSQGQVFAEGELVEVDGKLGFRVLTVSS